MANERSVIAAILFGGVSLISVSLLLYYFFFRPQQSVPLLENIQTAKEPRKEIEVEDVEDSDDEDDAEEDDDAPDGKEKADGGVNATELKEAYDAAVRVAQKFIKGEVSYLC